MSDFQDRYRTERDRYRVDNATRGSSGGGWAVLILAAVVVAIAGMLYLTAGPQTGGNIPATSSRTVTPEEAAPVSPETTGSIGKDQARPVSPAE